MSGQPYKTTVTAEHRLLDLHLKETLEYRDLIFLFVKRDFVSKYKQTVLGPLWALLQPLLSTLVFTLIFGKLAGLSTADRAGQGDIPGFLFYLAGTICWSYFSGTLSQTSNTFISNRATMGKVYYPRLVAPVATALSGLISFCIQFALFLAVWGFFLIQGGTGISLSAKILLVPLCILQLAALALGCGILISSVTTKYRDLAMLVGFGLQLWQYGSPVAYGLGLVPEKYRALYLLNPVTPVLTTFRYAMFGDGFFELSTYLLSWAVTLAVFFLGLILFSRIERTFMDTI